MKKVLSFVLVLAMALAMLISVTGCMGGTRLGDVVSADEIDSIEVEMDGFDAQKDIYDDGVKNLIFIVLNSKQLTDDENRINAVRDSFDNPQNVVAVFLYRTDKNNIAIFINKTTGAFVVADIENNGSEGNTRIYRYASPEGEEFDIEAIKSLVD